jgi:hypothetical protein
MRDAETDRYEAIGRLVSVKIERHPETHKVLKLVAHVEEAKL